MQCVTHASGSGNGTPRTGVDVEAQLQAANVRIAALEDRFDEEVAARKRLEQRFAKYLESVATLILRHTFTAEGDDSDNDA